jgi:hypothetical protein
MRKRLAGLVLWLSAALWAWWWEFIRSLVYERGSHIVTPFIESPSLDQILRWGPPLAFAGVGGLLFWKTRSRPSMVEDAKIGTSTVQTSASQVSLDWPIRAIDQRMPDEASLPSAIKEEIPDLRISDDPSIVALFEGAERDKLLPLLEIERIIAWGRPMGPGDPPLTRISGRLWSTHFLLTLPKQGQWSESQSFLKTKARQQTSYYDIHVNRTQIERIWPLRGQLRPMFEAVSHVSSCIGDNDLKECFPRARQEIRQAAHDGIIKIRGNKSAQVMGGGYSEVQSDIPPEYWEVAEIGPLATDKKSDDHPPHTFPQQFSDRRLGELVFLYAKLRVNWKEIITRWPLP